MIDTLSSTALAWLLTYLIHSTALLTLAWGLTRDTEVGRRRPRTCCGRRR